VINPRSGFRRTKKGVQRLARWQGIREPESEELSDETKLRKKRYQTPNVKMIREVRHLLSLGVEKGDGGGERAAVG